MDLLQVTARSMIGWMIYGLLEGTALALFVWLLLRLLPRQNAGTRFILWFSALLAIFFLPLLGGPARSQRMAASASGASSSLGLITLPISWAIAISVIWALIATMNLIRVIAGLWQINRLRQYSEEIDAKFLSPELTQLVREVRRSVSLRLSDWVQVPTAIGFLKPAIVLPRWFLEEISPQELKQVLVHELSHLRRRDDWTNLAQKFMKALLFFHPSAWWVEQQISLEREMACDDEVLARTANPMDYAQCLKRVAEKSFVRRQIVLAQAAVSRMRQVTLRVAQILDVNRPSTTRIWKPALPMILVAASLCGFAAWIAPALVAFTDDSPHPIPAVSAVSYSRPGSSLVKEVKASLAPVPSNMSAAYTRCFGNTNPRPCSASSPGKPVPRKTQMTVSHSPKLTLAATAPPAQPPQAKAYVEGDYVVQSEQFTVTMAGDQGTWRVQMWQVRVILPPDHSKKAIPRKNI
ncbi:MAG TPA: M56 family metallopeptidase [Candidatus Angelobacter sp.]